MVGAEGRGADDRLSQVTAWESAWFRWHCQRPDRSAPIILCRRTLLPRPAIRHKSSFLISSGTKSTERRVETTNVQLKVSLVSLSLCPEHCNRALRAALSFLQLLRRLRSCLNVPNDSLAHLFCFCPATEDLSFPPPCTAGSAVAEPSDLLVK